MEDIFDRLCFAKMLQPLDADSLNDEEQAEVVSCTAQFASLTEKLAATRNPGHVIEFGFVDSPKFAAFATTWEQTDFVVLHWGVITTLRSFFALIMAGPIFASWIHGAERPKVAKWFFECAKVFILWHEVGHIYHGHTSLIAKRGLRFIDELNAFPNDGLGGLDRQTLEMDADGFASACIFTLGTIGHEFPVRQSEFEAEHGESSTSLLMVSMCIFLVFRIFDAAIDFDDEEKKAHPAPALRLHMIAGSLAAAAVRDGHYDYEVAFDIIIAGISWGEEVYAKFHDKERDDAATAAAFGPKGVAYIQKLLRHWHVLFPQLEPLKRGGNLPPPQG